MFPLTSNEAYIKSTGERSTLGRMLEEGESEQIKKKANKSDLASISITGTTNNTGATITAGTYFYLNEAMVKAKTDIANGATLTKNTNYEEVTAGGLNSLYAELNEASTQQNLGLNSAYFDTTDTDNYCRWTKKGKIVQVAFSATPNADIPSGNIDLTDAGLPSPVLSMIVGDMVNDSTKARIGQVRISSNKLNYPFNSLVSSGTKIRITFTYVCV